MKRIQTLEVCALLPPANEVCEGYVFTPVCESFCSQGGCIPACNGSDAPPHPPEETRKTRTLPPGRNQEDSHPPPGRNQEDSHRAPPPPGRNQEDSHPAPLPLGRNQEDPPERQTHPPPPQQCMLGDTGNRRAVRIILECILVVQNSFQPIHCIYVTLIVGEELSNYVHK